MRPIRFITVATFLLLFSNAIFAASPFFGTPETISNKMITTLSNNVLLTDSQKASIKAKAMVFVRKIQNSNSNKSIEEIIQEHQQLTNEYEISLDSILTITQKEQLIEKREEHKQAIINKYFKK